MRASVNAAITDMSDGNTRRSINADFDRRIYTSPHYKANIFLEGYTSRNNKRNAAYYNPESDLALRIGLRHNWLNWREYDRSFRQILSTSIGQYHQENFGSSITWNIGYSHQWRINKELGFEYGITHRRQNFDGNREKLTAFIWQHQFIVLVHAYENIFNSF